MTDPDQPDLAEENEIAEIVSVALGNVILGWVQAGIHPHHVIAGVAKGVAGAVCDTSPDGSETHNLRAFAKALHMLADHSARLDAEDASLTNRPPAGSA